MQDSLAVSRSFGDILLKKWVISEPEIRKLQITSDCGFLVMASDGLWNKVHFFFFISSFYFEYMSRYVLQLTYIFLFKLIRFLIRKQWIMFCNMIYH